METLEELKNTYKKFISFSFARLNVKCPIFAYHGKI